STSSRSEYVARLTRLGLGGDEDHIVTSAYATAHYLERLDPRPTDVFVVGADVLRDEIRAVGIGVRGAQELPGAHPPPAAAASGREAVCIGKPEPFLFQEAIRRAGASAGPVVVVGDAPEYDIVAAHKVGALGVLITTGLTEQSAVAAATGDAAPDHVIGDLDQL